MPLVFTEVTHLQLITYASIRSSPRFVRGTVVLIAHRLSTVINATQICVIHKGLIVERGTHDELVAKGRENGVLMNFGVLKCFVMFCVTIKDL